MRAIASAIPSPPRADGDHLQSLAEHKPEQVHVGCTQRTANAEFFGALAEQIGSRAEQSHGSQAESQHSDGTCKHRRRKRNHAPLLNKCVEVDHVGRGRRIE